MAELGAHRLPPETPGPQANAVDLLGSILRVLAGIDARLARVEESLVQRRAGVVLHNSSISDETPTVEALPKNELPVNKNRRVFVFATAPIVIGPQSGTAQSGLQIGANVIQDCGHVPGDQAIFATRQPGVTAPVSVVVWEST